MEDSPKAKPRLLLTGFGPFPGTPLNASAELVKQAALQAVVNFPNIEVHSGVLPTEWQAAPEHLARLYQDFRPSIALHFGVSNLSRGFTIETIARNTCCTTLDAAGCAANGPAVMPGGASECHTRLPVELICQRLKDRNIPVELSTSAGTYLCNTIFYHSVTQSPGSAAAGFIHIPDSLSPTTKTIDGFSWEAAMAGMLEIIAVCVQAEEERPV